MICRVSVPVCLRPTKPYMYSDGAMKRLKKDKSSVLELMTDQKEKMDAFVAAQKINFKNAESLKKVFDYYNSIGN